MSRVTVLTGGTTPERDVALAGAAQVVSELRSSGHLISVVDTVFGLLSGRQEQDLLQPAVGRLPPTHEELTALAERENLEEIVRLLELREVDCVFLLLHGRQGEGGDLQAMLDGAGITYTGSGAAASALAMDKNAAKQRIMAAGVATHLWEMWPASEKAIENIGFPMIVKPSRVGSSVGMELVRSRVDLQTAVDNAKKYDDQVMLEQFLPGRELTVGVLGDKALAVGEILPKHELFDYECKYTQGMTEEVFPAEVENGLSDELQSQALAVHQALGLRDFSRVDFKEDASGVPQCLEANTLPGMTSTSLLPQSAAAAGVSFADLLNEICSLAIKRTHSGNKDGP